MTLTVAAAVLACPLMVASAHAQALPDPTRPSGTLSAHANPGAAEGELPRLQSVLIAPRPGGRQVAVIDGETVLLGGSFKGARVARITQAEVELVRGRERQVLRLYPATTPATSPATSPADAGAALAN
ncbi:hypothetical protein [Massilia sp. H6]|uniref:hypothetical protein n=1 Tax=Massilia sp. H6 TaxID=2970464 RepID=UPI00216A37D5|nr:hypothetical protein [Massilia sp. H6]UVW26938.1 hypothetical protein NRS07_10135 [Massilia sp. H6]